MNPLHMYEPGIHGMMTGVRRIRRNGDAVTLEYEDSSEESANIPETRWAEIRANWFAIVSEVQSARVVKVEA